MIQSNYQSSLVTFSAGIGLCILGGAALSQVTSSNTPADHQTLPCRRLQSRHRIRCGRGRLG